jgi:hypothetical protein
MPNLQHTLCCSVHPYHPVDTGRGAVNFRTGAEPSGALCALFSLEVEEAAMSATVIPLSTYDRLYPLGDPPKRGGKSYGSRTPPLYSLPCGVHLLSCVTGTLVCSA